MLVARRCFVGCVVVAGAVELAAKTNEAATATSSSSKNQQSDETFPHRYREARRHRRNGGTIGDAEDAEDQHDNIVFPSTTSTTSRRQHGHRGRHGHGHRRSFHLQKEPQTKLRQRRGSFHNMVNHVPVRRHVSRRSSPSGSPALDLMWTLSRRDVLDTHHPALHEIVKVAGEIARSKDEALAKATVPVMQDSLSKLASLAALDDPGASDFISDMRAQVCASKKDTERETCQSFMDEYCATRGDSAACKAFMGSDEEEEDEGEPIKEEENGDEEGADGDENDGAAEDQTGEAENPGPKPSGDPTGDLPEQGFEGDMVNHVDGETQTDDWRREFGPGQPDTYASVCAEHPNNEWCRLHGYGGGFHAAAYRTSSALTTTMLIAGGGAFLLFVGGRM
ncbi:unnamed protein product [Amoebophrya sp. A25]|nr:unnamed protein product [Amoebophrya sp. A25]|eukprot:GSA25T00007904001.1